MNAPLVYVLIINWNGREHLDACFSSLLECPYAHAVFLLIDNASTDGSVPYVREHFGHDGRVEILALDENRGWSGGNNAGIARAREAGADYLFLLNNDTAVAPDALSVMVDAMARRPDCAALAPRMVLFDQPAILNSIGLELSVVGAAWDRGIGALDGPKWHAEVPVVGVCGGACFLRAAALHHTTLLPEQFEIYFDDLDLCLQLWRAGYSVWTCPQAVVRHKFSATMGEGSRARRKYFLNTRNRFWLMARHLPLPTLLRSLPKILLGEVRAVGRSLLDGEAWKVWAHIRAWSSALLYVPEARKYRHEADSSPSGDVWTLVRATPWFCPPISVPVQGCYPAEDRGAAQVTPLAPHATLNIPPGPLQVFASNCYPQAGPVTLSLRFQGQVLHTLHCADQVETTLDTPGGTLTVDSSLDEASEHPSRHDARMVFLRLEQDGTPIAINPDAPWVATQDIAQPSGLADQRR